MKTQLMQALTGDEVLRSMVGRVENSDLPSIFFNSPVCRCGFPAVAFFESGGGDAVFADDVCVVRTVVFQLDVWAEENLGGVTERVLTLVRGLGYAVDSTADIPDPNIGHTQIICKKLV